MGILNFFKNKNHNIVELNKHKTDNNINSKSIEFYCVDSSSIDKDERPYYQPDDYYTMYSYPGTEMSQKVVTFEERKKTSYPSKNGLYVAEILLLYYCSQCKYPKPKSGYPGFWWFKYGIRDVGHELIYLEQNGFIKWAQKKELLPYLTIDELKYILSSSNLSVNGKKAELIDRINQSIPESRINIPDYTPKYTLTKLGLEELEQNGYVPYMHNNKNATSEDEHFGKTFNVWSINKIFKNGDASNWREVVGKIETEMFGIDLVNAKTKTENPKIERQKQDYLIQRDSIRKFLEENIDIIKEGIAKSGDGYSEEAEGFALKNNGDDKGALLHLYIAIGKKFDAPALYKTTAILLHKYGMYEEELTVINEGLKNINKNSAQSHTDDLLNRKSRVEKILNTKN